MKPCARAISCPLSRPSRSSCCPARSPKQACHARRDQAALLSNDPVPRPGTVSLSKGGTIPRARASRTRSRLDRPVFSAAYPSDPTPAWYISRARRTLNCYVPGWIISCTTVDSPHSRSYLHDVNLTNSLTGHILRLTLTGAGPVHVQQVLAFPVKNGRR